MRCIFCKADSKLSRSVEHVIPESLGNSTLVLPKGVVCDPCNNYFSREVEKPFLEAPAIRIMRFHQALESKKVGFLNLPASSHLELQQFSLVSLDTTTPR